MKAKIPKDPQGIRDFLRNLKVGVETQVNKYTVTRLSKDVFWYEHNMTMEEASVAIFKDCEYQDMEKFKRGVTHD